MITYSGYRVKFGISILLTIVGCCLLIAGFIVPPIGIIHSSVLVAFGETCTFVGTLLGINYVYNYELFRARLASKVLKDIENSEKLMN